MYRAGVVTARVFVSYSHDSEAHDERVLALADRLRSEGLDVRLDRYVESPPEGWPVWMRRQATECDFVLLVCTPEYRRRFDREDTGGAGKGVKWEAMLAEQLLYEAGARNEKLIPVLLPGGREEDVPIVLRAYTRYRLPEGYERLYRRLTRQPEIEAPPIGAIRVMAPRARPGVSGGGVAAAGQVAEQGVAAAADGHEAVGHDAIVDELARVLWDGDEARLAVQRAGLPPAMIPAFRQSLTFWTAVADGARNGTIAGGVRALVEQAARLYPGNAVFRRYLGR